MTPTSVRSSPRESSVFRPISCDAVDHGVDLGLGRGVRHHDDHGDQRPLHGVQVGLDRLRAAQVGEAHRRLRARRCCRAEGYGCTSARRAGSAARRPCRGRRAAARRASRAGAPRRRETRRQVVRRREVGEADLGRVEVVEADQLAQQLLGRLDDRLGGVRRRGRRAADSSHRHAFSSSLTRRSRVLARVDLVHDRAAHHSRVGDAAQRLHVLRPRDAEAGRDRQLGVLAHLARRAPCSPAGSSLRAPVMPVTVTQ